MRRMRALVWMLRGCDPLTYPTHELEELIEEVFDQRLVPAMKLGYDNGFAAGVAWALDDLMQVPLIQQTPELRRWARDARAFAGEHWDLERP